MISVDRRAPDGVPDRLGREIRGNKVTRPGPDFEDIQSWVAGCF